MLLGSGSVGLYEQERGAGSAAVERGAGVDSRSNFLACVVHLSYDGHSWFAKLLAASIPKTSLISESGVLRRLWGLIHSSPAAARTLRQVSRTL